MESTQSLTFKVARKRPQFITPANPTPHEFKVLSDIDHHQNVRFRIWNIHIFQGKDLVEIIRDAVGKALVFYYPFAGRLRECSGGKLVVECTGEGVLFIEADADVTLQQFGVGDTLYPPFPCVKELIYEVAGVLNTPILVIQVTHLKCGAFMFAVGSNHTMSDATGLAQFWCAVVELAGGADTISVPPVWERHLLTTHNMQRVLTSDDIPFTEATLNPPADMVHRWIPFGAAEFSALRSRLPLHLRGCSNFELLTACLWRCRTIAISLKPNHEVRIICGVNIRNLCNPPLPEGYYGNAIAFPAAISTAGELSRNPLHYALELVRKTKFELIEELKNSSVEQFLIRSHKNTTAIDAGFFAVSDLTQIVSDKMDFGWGTPVYIGAAEPTIFTSFYIPFKNNKGETRKIVLLCLPANAMEVFVKELERMLKGEDETMADRKTTPFIESAL